MENIKKNTKSSKMSKKVAMISVNDLFNKSFAMYKTIFWQVIRMLFLSFLATVPLLLILGLYITVRVISSANNVEAVLNIILGFLAIASLVFFIVVAYIAQVATKIIIQKNDAKLKTKNAFMIAKDKSINVLKASLLATLFIFLWTFLFIIPGIIASIYFTFVVWVVLEENISGMQAVKRSKFLVKGYWWAVFGRLILPIIIIMFSFGVLSYFIADDNGLGKFIYDFLSQIFSWLAAPFFIAYSYLMYKSLVKIKDNKST